MPSLLFSFMPQISIILCTYNRAEYLNKCIDSVVNQTFQDWELVIVDDGSDDRTFDIVDSYVQQRENIRYLKHKNRKLALSKNAGIQASFGKYITFLDSDDQYKSEHLESRLSYMKDHPETDLIEGGFETDEEIFVSDYFQPGKTINLKDCVLGPTFFGKRPVFFELRGFNEIAYGEDTDFWHRAEKVFRTDKLSYPETYIYTRATTSITKTVLEQMK
jgi:glycosyltransferase involved in cell wall biosynthesis